MHICVCLITLDLPLIICNLTNLSLYRLLAHATRHVYRDTRGAMCMRHTKRAHRWFIPDSLKSFC